MKKFCVSFCLILCLLSQLFVASAKSDSATLIENQFVVNLSCSDSDVSLENIEISVYSAHIAYYDDSFDYYEYEETYAFSVVTDSDGMAIFDRPSDCFSITIEIDTLPEHYGINEHTRFFDENTRNHWGHISKIENVDIRWEQGEAIPELTDANGRCVYADTKVEYISDEGNTALYSIDTENSCISYNETVLVTVCGQDYLFENPVAYIYANDIDKADYLYENGFVSEEEYIESLCNAVLSGDFQQNSTVECGIDNMEVYRKIYDFYEANKTQLSSTSNIKNVLNLISAPAAIDSSAYVLSSNGKFRVSYDTSLDSINSAVAKKIAEEFESIRTLFCTKWGFIEAHSTTSYYRVEISEDTPTAVTHNDGKGNSWTVIGVKTAEGVYNGIGIYRGFLAHEYFHAILNSYGIHSSTNNDIQWMHESFASWAGIAYCTEYALYRKDSVNEFLSTANKSLTYITGNRHYGTCVFPLYIDQQMGGYKTIKKIAELYANSNDPLTAVDAGLKYYGYSLATAFAGCASYNFNASYFYNVCSDWGGVKISQITSYPNTTSPMKNINPLACDYLQFKPLTNTTSTLTVTINITGATGNAKAMVKTVREKYDGSYVISDASISSNRCTIVCGSFGGVDAKSFTVIPINAGTDGTLFYTRTATLSYKLDTNTVYTIKNSGSGKYLNVHYGVDANGTNVYQWTKDGSTEQKFKLEKNDNGTYYIRAMCSSNGTNRVLDIVKSGGKVVSGCNVEIYTPVDPVAQEWILHSNGDGRYIICPASNSVVVLTAIGSSNGTGSGTGSTAAGNVIVSTYMFVDSQIWEFIPA